MQWSLQQYDQQSYARDGVQGRGKLQGKGRGMRTSAFRDVGNSVTVCDMVAGSLWEVVDEEVRLVVLCGCCHWPRCRSLLHRLHYSQ